MERTANALSAPEGVPQVIEGEITLERRGTYAFLLDLNARLFHWNDHRQWNNSFVRALGPSQLAVIREAVLQWPAPLTSPGDPARPLYWTVSVLTDRKTLNFSGENKQDTVWRHVSQLLEKLGREGRLGLP